MIEGERNDDAVFMVTQLASLFRISLSKGRTVISIKDELVHARNYMNIQKVRYKEAFEISWKIAERFVSREEKSAAIYTSVSGTTDWECRLRR